MFQIVRASERRNLLFSRENVINGMPDGNFMHHEI